MHKTDKFSLRHAFNCFVFGLGKNAQDLLHKRNIKKKNVFWHFFTAWRFPESVLATSVQKEKHQLVKAVSFSLFSFW